MKLCDLLGVSSKANKDVGLELEIEGNVPDLGSIKYWKTTVDGSLRGGYEYISKGPIAISSVRPAMEELHAAFVQYNARPEFSFRTSNHVHLNMLEYDAQEILRIVYLMWVLEPILINASGSTRKTNRFCLSTQDSDSPILAMERVVRIKEDMLHNIISSYRTDTAKYSAINLASLSRLGTLEIRTMEGTIDTDRIVNWCTLLHNIKMYALRFENLTAIDNAISDQGARNFVRNICGDVFPQYDFATLEDEITLQRSLLINILYLNKEIENEVKNPAVPKRQPERPRPQEFAAAGWGPPQGDHLEAVGTRPIPRVTDNVRTNNQQIRAAHEQILRGLRERQLRDPNAVFEAI